MGPDTSSPDSSTRPNPVDLRSDTVTRPTEAMYLRMRAAPLGDDGLEGDPTVRELEAVASRALGKEAGLFVPSCTMANLLAILAQVGRSEQILLEAQAHMINTERGAATFTGTFLLGIPGMDGAMDLDRLEDALRPDASPLRTGMIALETSPACPPPPRISTSPRRRAPRRSTRARWAGRRAGARRPARFWPAPLP